MIVVQNVKIMSFGRQDIIKIIKDINVKVALRLLEPYNVIVDSVMSGKECLDKVLDGQYYDLILLDDMMPVMSGIETFGELKRIAGFMTPTVALTANALSGMKEKYLAEGFDDYLAKPIDKDELSRVIKKFLDKKD